jgi:sugar-phosphatase
VRQPPRTRPVAVVFDLDGVIVDTQAIVRAGWRRFVALHGLTLRESDLPRIYGRRTVDILEDVFGMDAAMARAAAEDWAARRTGEVAALDELPEVAGAPDFVRAARRAGFRIGLASSALRANVERAVRLTGLEGAFEVVVAAEDVERGKPDPEPYLMAAAALGIAPDSTLVFEDTPPGISAARAAGAHCVALTTTFPATLLGEAELVVPDFRGLDPVAVAERLST